MFLLVHSPVVGPSTWRWVAEALRAAGEVVCVPDLVPAALTGDPAAFVGRAASECPTADDVVVVGHSGAGAVLPLIAANLGQERSSTVFVDAGVPPCEGIGPVGGAFLGRLREMAVDGVLPVWSRWWGDGVLEGAVPDHRRRQEIEAELANVPLAFFEAAVETPGGWCGGPVAYVLLSDPYRDDARKGSALGWPVVERLGGHLDIVNASDAIASILLDVTARF